MPKKDVWNIPPVIPNKAAARLATKVQVEGSPQGGRALNAKERKFVEEYVSGDGRVTLKEAAIRAGYAEGSASVMAWKLTNPSVSPHVVAAIQRYRAELASKYNTSYERHMRDLQIIRDKALEAGAYGAAVQAEYRRGQALGTIYVERKEIRHGTIDSMSKEEVQRKLDELKRLYGGPPPTALLDADTGQVIQSLERDKDPEFDPGVAEPGPDLFELQNAEGDVPEGVFDEDDDEDVEPPAARPVPVPVEEITEEHITRAEQFRRHKAEQKAREEAEAAARQALVAKAVDDVFKDIDKEVWDDEDGSGS